MKTFVYHPSRKVRGWGYSFDSLLELKFALSIKEDYEFLRSQIRIYYDPRTRMSTNYIRESIRRYTPDFLMRHKVTGEAYLVEIKPDGFKEDKQLANRKAVAENYIRYKNYDWKFKMVFGNEIFLDEGRSWEFHDFCKAALASRKGLPLKSLHNYFDYSCTSIFNVPSNQKLRFVMFGERNEYYKGTG